MKGVYFKYMTGVLNFILGEGEQRREAKAVTSFQVFYPSQQ